MADLLKETRLAETALLELGAQGLNPPCRPSCTGSSYFAVMLGSKMLLGYIALSRHTSD